MLYLDYNKFSKIFNTKHNAKTNFITRLISLSA